MYIVEPEKDLSCREVLPSFCNPQCRYMFGSVRISTESIRMCHCTSGQGSPVNFAKITFWEKLFFFLNKSTGAIVQVSKAPLNESFITAPVGGHESGLLCIRPLCSFERSSSLVSFSTCLKELREAPRSKRTIPNTRPMSAFRESSA